MTELNQIYRCEVCGNVVQVLRTGAGQLVCCGQPMKLEEEKTIEQEGKEKHVPVVEGLKIKVGSEPHPMEEEHHIELIQAFVDGKLVVEKRLYPGDKPELEISEKYQGRTITARTLCNIHGLWKSA